jgi:hypothetical protein
MKRDLNSILDDALLQDHAKQTIWHGLEEEYEVVKLHSQKEFQLSRKSVVC